MLCISTEKKVVNVVKCPYCGYEGKFKEIRSSWKFRFYTVKMLECPVCHGKFNYYRGVSPRSGKVTEFVIRVKPRK